MTDNTFEVDLATDMGIFSILYMGICSIKTAMPKKKIE